MKNKFFTILYMTISGLVAILIYLVLYRSFSLQELLGLSSFFIFIVFLLMVFRFLKELV